MLYYHSSAENIYSAGLTNVAKGLKENILEYVLSENATSLIITGNGKEACRINKFKDNTL